MNAKTDKAAAAAATATRRTGLDPLVASRGVDPRKLYGDAFGVGTRVLISFRTGDWGKNNLGIVQCIATVPDQVGRFFVGVLPDGFRGNTGRPEHKQLHHWPDYEPGKPPLPGFEAGLLKPIEEPQ
jgi:hypothetical protein